MVEKNKSRKLKISTENAEFQIIESLKSNRSKRQKLGEVFVEGIESIKQADKAGMEFSRVIFSKKTSLSLWAVDLLKKHPEASQIEMEDSLYRKICDRDQPSEMVLTLKMPRPGLKDLESLENPFILIFDRPSDCGNFGTILRSANSFKVDAVLVFGHAIDIYDPKVIRSSLGSIFHSKVVKIESLEELSRWVELQKQRSGLTLIGTDSTGEISLGNHTLKAPAAVILGNEAKGMSVSLQNLCDQMVRIPLSGEVNSLNVSCAGSIILWEIYKNGLSS